MGEADEVEFGLEMPRKLSTVRPVPEPNLLSFGEAASHRHQMAQLGMQVISEWSSVDLVVNGIFVAMLGANPRPAAAMFDSLKAAGKRDALEAVAELFFRDNPERLDTFAALSELYGRVAEQRNRVAHWMWGHHPALPEDVLLADTSRFLAGQVKRSITRQTPLAELLKNHTPGKPIGRIFEPIVEYDGVHVYTRQDFMDIRGRIGDLENWLARFQMVVDHQAYHRDSALWVGNFSPERILARLSAVPAIQTAVGRQRRRQERKR